LGDRFLIYGAGTMGLMLLLLAERVGALSVTIVEPNAARRQKAVTLGATTVLASAEHLEGAKFDVVIDASGVVAAIEDGLHRVRPGGSFLQFGVASSEAVAQWSPFKVYNEEITIVGSMAVLKSYDRACDLVIEAGLDLEALVSGQFKLEQYPEALARARSGEGYKLQVVPG
jgi:threonine dehydrogenase-like Zn-dependent dehydrogenase